MKLSPSKGETSMVWAEPPPVCAEKLLPAVFGQYFMEVWTLPLWVIHSTNRLVSRPSTADEPANLVFITACLLSCKLGFKDASASKLPQSQVGQDPPQRQREPFSFPASSAPSGRAMGAAGPIWVRGCAMP